MPDRAAASRRRLAVVLVVIAQALGTSLWFSPSGAAEGLMASLRIGTAAFGWLIAATQLGFIAGTLCFAVSGVGDRFAASRICAAGCLAGAALNAATAIGGLGYEAVWALRLGVGVCLAGIYPLGMKMIVQWVGGRPAAALGWLLGMLTLGTALPHGLRASGTSWPWEGVVLATSALALAGALILLLLGDGPHAAPARKPGASARPSPADARRVFAIPGFRASALGYFGHMWELYAFWSVLPLLCAPISAELIRRGASAGGHSVAALSFAAIAMGCIGCVAGGIWSRRIGSARVAAVALAGSGGMCLLYPLIPDDALTLRLAALGFWGLCVIADSPQFSALSAQHAPPEWLGSALLAQNGIGFLITVASIVILSLAVPVWGASAMWILAPGPLLGLWALRPLWRGAAGLGDR